MYTMLWKTFKMDTQPSASVQQNNGDILGDKIHLYFEILTLNNVTMGVHFLMEKKMGVASLFLF